MKNPRTPAFSNNFAILPESGSIVQRVGATSRGGSSTTETKVTYTEDNKFDEVIEVGKFKITPNGPDNLFPYHFKELLDKNNIFHSILREKIDLILTGGTYLYTEALEGKEIIKVPVLDKEITNWLESWDFDNFLLEQVTNFIYIENTATLFVSNKARRLPGYENKRKIAELRAMPIEEIRMGVYNAQNKITDYFQANWYHPETILKYNAYNRLDPFRYPASMFFVKMPSFGSKYYGRPPFIGITDYLNLKELIINWSIDNLKNTSFKWHIQSPFSYWDKIQEANGWDNTQLEKYEKDVLVQIDKFLASEKAENASKRFHTKFGIDNVTGKETGWKLIALEDNTEKNSKAYLDASSNIDESIIASAHLDPSLSNIQISGKLSSGLDKLIAFNIHQLVSTPTPRRLILSPVNEAIRINWPNKDIKIGFHDTQLEYAQKAVTNTNEEEKK